MIGINRAIFLIKDTFKHYLSFRLLSSAVPEMERPLVTIKAGQLQGSMGKLYDGSPYYSFKGIPYAQPPVGKLRFKSPTPIKPWKGIKVAIEHGPICPQVDTFTGVHMGEDENCLVLNVYSKSLKTNSKLPVMVFIHGGAFMSGSGGTDMYGPEILTEHDVVLVTINYRLELLGFLCLDIPEVPGNAGLRDQVLALKWVQENIEQFGGDYNNVTLFGESAGAASISYHMLSQMSNGLFHKAMLQSGVCFLDWAHQKDPVERAFRIGKLLGCETNDKIELLEFLQNVPVSDLSGKVTFKTRTVTEKNRDLPIFLCPVVEKKFEGIIPFISEDPINILMKNQINHVPLVIGYTSGEGIVMIKNTIKNADLFNKEPKYKVPRQLYENVSETKLQELGNRIKKFYTKDIGYVNSDPQCILDLESDINFVYNIHRFTNFYLNSRAPTYLYKFDCDTELNVMKKLLGISNIVGTCHADDLFYIFSSLLTKEAYEENEKLRDITYRISKLWTNFAKYGDPTPDMKLGVKWTPYGKENDKYLLIREEKFSMSANEEKDRIEFWNKLYKEANLPFVSRSNL